MGSSAHFLPFSSPASLAASGADTCTTPPRRPTEGPALSGVVRHQGAQHAPEEGGRAPPPPPLPRSRGSHGAAYCGPHRPALGPEPPCPGGCLSASGGLCPTHRCCAREVHPAPSCPAANTTSTPPPHGTRVYTYRHGGVSLSSAPRRVRGSSAVWTAVRPDNQGRYPVEPVRYGHTGRGSPPLAQAEIQTKPNPPFPAWTRSVHLDAPGQRHGQQPVSRTADTQTSQTGQVILRLR